MRQFAIILMLLLCSGPVSGQLNPRAHGISLNPFGVVAGTMELRYEARSGESTSLHAGLRYYALNRNWTAPGIGGGIRWYLYPDGGATSLSGFSIGPHAYLIYWLYETDYEYDIRRVALLVGVDAAYKWVWDHFFLEPSVSLAVYPLTAEDSPKAHSGLDPTFGIHLGYAW